jgi:WXG100 family type VII secretion target
MAGDADDLLYNYEGIDTVSEAIVAFVNQMNANLDEVDTKFKNLLAHGWGGAGADAFQVESQKWHMAAAEMAQTLHTLSTKIGDAAITMRQVDIQAAARFTSGN